MRFEALGVGGSPKGLNLKQHRRGAALAEPACSTGKIIIEITNISGESLLDWNPHDRFLDLSFKF